MNFLSPAPFQSFSSHCSRQSHQVQNFQNNTRGGWTEERHKNNKPPACLYILYLFIMSILRNSLSFSTQFSFLLYSSSCEFVHTVERTDSTKFVLTFLEKMPTNAFLAVLAHGRKLQARLHLTRSKVNIGRLELDWSE